MGWWCKCLSEIEKWQTQWRHVKAIHINVSKLSQGVRPGIFLIFSCSMEKKAYAWSQTLSGDQSVDDWNIQQYTATIQIIDNSPVHTSPNKFLS